MYRHITEKIKFPRKGLNPNLKHGSFANLVNFDRNVMILGFGSIGQGVLPLVLRHFNMPYENIKIVTAPDDIDAPAAHKAAERYGVGAEILEVTTSNYKQFLSSQLKKGDLLLNATVDVSSVDVIEHCINNEILYSDTVIEPWKGVYFDADLPIHERSNYFFREQLLNLKRKYPFERNKYTTAISCHGANPGLVNHFVKQGLINIAKDTNYEGVTIGTKEPETQNEWAQLASDLNVKCIHIAERDTQTSVKRKEKGEFINTWSVDSFIYEAWAQVSELGWGTHELCLPFDGKEHTYGNKSSIYLKQPGILTKVRTWTPMAGAIHGFCVTHNESITLADYLSVWDKNKLLYRPTVHYAYHPCDDAVLSMHEFIGSGGDENTIKKDKLLLFDDIDKGVDELGVLLCGHKNNAYWYGSQLDIKDVADRIEDNQATSLQVTATLMAGGVYAINNKHLGILECEELDYKYILDIVEPYVAPVVGKYTDWTPLQNRNQLGYNENINIYEKDPWQFRNVRCFDFSVPYSFDQLKEPLEK